MKIRSLCLVLVPVVLVVSCSKEEGGKPSDKGGQPAAGAVTVPEDHLAIFAALPTGPKAETASSPAKIALGKKLYHDTRMSPDGSVSCATCHSLDTYGVDNKKVSEGFKGQTGDRNAPTSLNAFRHVAQFWDGRAATVEEQAMGPVLNPIEHGFTKEADAMAGFKKDAALVAEFKKVFPGEADPVTLKNVGHAIGAFERTLTTKSRFDAFLDGDKSALTDAEKQGMIDFVGSGCTTCHNGRLVGGLMFNKLGLIHPWETEDTGRFKHTKNEIEKYYFKVPSLLNIEKTGPYLHDGSIASLEEMVKKMAWHQVGKKLDDKTIASIVVFLKALTGKLPG